MEEDLTWLKTLAIKWEGAKAEIQKDCRALSLREDGNKGEESKQQANNASHSSQNPRILDSTWLGKLDK